MIEESSVFLAVVKSLGVPGLITWVSYRLFDKYLGKFLTAVEMQAKAMQDLATCVSDSRDDSKEIVLAVRVLSSKVDENTGWLKQVSSKILGEESTTK